MTSIFVAKLDFGVVQEDLKTLFEQYGKVNKVTVATDRETGKSRGFAFVEMFDQEEARRAISELDGSTFKGREMAVKEAEDRSKGPATPFKREASPESKRETGSDFSPPPADFIPEFTKPETGAKFETRKKSDKKVAKGTSDGQPRSTKMPAYKKSGKNKRFFEADDEDDF